MSKIISKIISLWRDLSEKEARDEYVSARIDIDLSHQIFSLREQRGWTQGELAARCGYGNSQGRISKLEQSCEGVSVSTLKKLASAFDVSLSIKFVSFSQSAREAAYERLDRHIPSFPDDSIESLCAGEFQLISYQTNPALSEVSMADFSVGSEPYLNTWTTFDRHAPVSQGTIYAN